MSTKRKQTKPEKQWYLLVEMEDPEEEIDEYDDHYNEEDGSRNLFVGFYSTPEQARNGALRHNQAYQIVKGTIVGKIQTGTCAYRQCDEVTRDGVCPVHGKVVVSTAQSGRKHLANGTLQSAGSIRRRRKH